VLGQATGNLGLIRLTIARIRGKPPPSPYSILYVFPRHLHPNDFLSRDSQGGVPKLSRFGLRGLCEFITLCFRLGWGLKQTDSSPWDLSNGVSHSTCTHQGWFDSRLLVVESQIDNLTLEPSFCHNLCCRCPNGSCEAIFYICALIDFQWYKERLKAMCFNSCNWTLKFWESHRTPKSPFWECECHPHTLPKVGLRQIDWHSYYKMPITYYLMHVSLFLDSIL
jgi:hypothetical protein